MRAAVGRSSFWSSVSAHNKLRPARKVTTAAKAHNATSETRRGTTLAPTWKPRELITPAHRNLYTKDRGQHCNRRRVMSMLGPVVHGREKAGERAYHRSC